MLETCFHGGQLFWDGSGGPIPKLGLWVKLSCGSEGGGVVLFRDTLKPVPTRPVKRFQRPMGRQGAIGSHHRSRV